MHMVLRQFWVDRIESLWRTRNVIWLTGVRRAGKTTLCHSLPQVEYFDCELPRVRRLVEDPQAFLDSVKGKRVILDEIHRLADPSELLKIAADYYPETFVLATGSSTLGASAKFKDTLTGRKRELWLTPMTQEDQAAFGRTEMGHRFLHGGLPPFFLSAEIPERDFQEWMDAYWAKDIQELFRLERRHAFQKFAELLMAQSGGIFEATRFAAPCEMSRATVSNYLAVLEATHVVHVLRPFSSHAAAEIVAAPKVYGFDTGFICYFRGWHTLRREDMGSLWEHYVLNELHANLQTRDIGYWRDKSGHEVDFILVRQGQPPIAIECKWSAEEFDASSLTAFRRRYAKGESYVVTSDVDRSFRRDYHGTQAIFTSLRNLITTLEAQ